MKNKINLIHFSLKGVNLNRVYKYCQKENIALYNIDRKDYKNIEFDINYKDKKHFYELVKLQNYACIESQTQGKNKISNFVKLRFGLIFGAFLFIFFNIFSSFMIFDIKIYGNSYVDSSKIIQVLNIYNITVGKFVKNQDFNFIETEITNNIEDISLCSIMKKGTTIVVNVKEKLKNEEMQFISQGKDIVATQNFTLTELVVANGTAKKKVGDSVKAGDIIVAGYVLDSYGKKINCKASANIKAKTWFSASEIYKKELEINVRTGKKVINSYLDLFGVKYPIKNTKNEFEFFEEELKETEIKNNFLPFKMYTTTYYEITKQVVEQDFEKDRQKILEKCQKQAYSKVVDTSLISNMFDTITEEKDCFVITSYIEVNLEF